MECYCCVADPDAMVGDVGQQSDKVSSACVRFPGAPNYACTSEMEPKPAGAVDIFFVDLPLKRLSLRENINYFQLDF